MHRNILLEVIALLCILLVAADNHVYYKVVVMSLIDNPDGFPRPVLGVFEDDGNVTSKSFPGPLIRATVGDIVHFTVRNGLHTSLTSMHFHGLLQLNNPWMDGVEGLTQCGILPGASFEYVFRVTHTGTFWYHSHTGAQYGDGVQGPIIVDYVKHDPVMEALPYSNEHVVMITDWFHESGEDLMLYYKGPHPRLPRLRLKYPWPTTSLLINGRGYFDCKTYTDCTWLDPKNYGHCDNIPQCIESRKPLFGKCEGYGRLESDVFQCEPGNRTRLRIINSSKNLPLKVWVDRHKLIIVTRDGHETKHHKVDFLTIAVGQRMDVILECDQKQDYNYHLFVSIPENYIPKGAVVPKITATALIVYKPGAQSLLPQKMPHSHDENGNPVDDYPVFEYDLRPLTPMLAPPATKRIFIDFSVVWTTRKEMPLEEWAVNGQTFHGTKLPLLPATYAGYKLKDLINHEPGSGVDRTTIIEDLEWGEIYEVVMINRELQQHPWHLHGHDLWFIDVGPFDPYINETDECGQRTINATCDVTRFLEPYDAPAAVLTVGDSFTVPGYGYTVFRFRANNPGVWFFHCHVEWHLALGMAMIFRTNDPHNYMSPPPKDYAQCFDPVSDGVQPEQIANADVVVDKVSMVDRSIHKVGSLWTPTVKIALISALMGSVVTFFVTRMTNKASTGEKTESVRKNSLLRVSL